MGGDWHSHKVGPSYDSGIALPEEYDSQPNAILTLCYLNGFQSDEDGGLKIIRGSHLFRDPTGCVAKTDEEMENGWLNGRIHPITGKPLEIAHLKLSPGTMVSFVHHMPHHVGFRMPEAPVRWGLLMANRTPDHGAIPARWSNGVPAHWAERNAGRISEEARRVLAGDNPVDPLQ